MSKQASTRQASDQGKRTAREYLRVSQDRSGRARSVTEQEADNRRQWPALAFNGESYSDISVSASRYSTKVRGGYKRLINDIKNDRFDADVLVLWEASRGSRKVGEWVELIELCESKGIEIAVTTDHRIYDPRNARDRRSLQENAVDAEYESAKVSDRVTRAVESSARNGRPHGRPPLGYVRRFTSTGVVEQIPDEDYAPIIRELFERIAAGDSIRGIATDLADRGITDPSGKPFTQQRLGQLARRHAYAGLRIYDPGRKGQNRPSVDAEIIEGDWPAIVAPSLFWRVQRVLSDPARKTRKPGGAKHLVSMIARCGTCGGPITARYDNGARAYHCRDKGHVRILADDVDQLAAEVTIGFLSDPSTYDRLMAQADDTAAAERLQADVETIRTELDDLADQVGRGELSATLAARAEPAILQRLADAEAALAKALVPPVLDGLVGPEDDVRHMWSEASMAKRREVLRIVAGAVGTLTVHPSGVAGPNQPPAHERITFEK